MAARGFWSYVHKDDEAEGGRVTRLGRDVVAQYEVLTGDAIELFLDRDSLEWGDDWRPKVDGALSSIAFFIPVLTPRYFQRAECRRELNFFARRATRLGVRELVMPILYVDVPALHDDPPGDEAMALVKPFQYVPWTDLRFADVNSGEYRRAVSALAQRLVEANTAAERVDVAAAAATLETASNGEAAADDEPGLVDRIAATEEAMPAWADTVALVGAEIEVIGKLMQGAVLDLEKTEKSARPMAARLTVLRQVAKGLREPADRLRQFGDDFTRQLHDVDDGVRLLIARASEEAAESAEATAAACAFFNAVRSMAEAAEKGLGALQGMIDSMRPIESMSRDLRPILRSLREGLTLMVEGRDVILQWVALMDDSSLDCVAAS